jgi:hypothetical protein
MLFGACEFRHEVTVGFDDDGRLLALKDRVHGDVGARSVGRLVHDLSGHHHTPRTVQVEKLSGLLQLQ